MQDVPSFSSPKSGKFLTFGLAGTRYGLEIIKVREIIGMMEIISVPRTPDFVRGCMNLRGTIVPVLDLREIFQLERVDDTEATCIIVVELEGICAGLVVDRINEVLDLDADEIEAAPDFGVAVNVDFVLGMGKKEGEVTILLNIDEVLSHGETFALQQLADAARDRSFDSSQAK